MYVGTCAVNSKVDEADAFFNPDVFVVGTGSQVAQAGL